MLTRKKIKNILPIALETFKNTMSPISSPYPEILLSDSTTYEQKRTDLVKHTGSTHTDEPYLLSHQYVEYIHGDNDGVILIYIDAYKDYPDDYDDELLSYVKYGDEDFFAMCLWRELGRFYAVKTDQRKLYRYDDVDYEDDDSLHQTDNTSGRKIGYCFWIEFISVCIANYVSYKMRSAAETYDPYNMDWDYDTWSSVAITIADMLLLSISSTSRNTSEKIKSIYWIKEFDKNTGSITFSDGSTKDFEDGLLYMDNTYSGNNSKLIFEFQNDKDAFIFGRLLGGFELPEIKEFYDEMPEYLR